MTCDKCKNNTSLLVVVYVKTEFAKGPYSKDKEQWCANCVVERAIKSKFKGGPQ